MKSFKVVNPLIIGQLNTEYVAENGLQAASQFWNDISSHVTNNLPHTYVTLKDANNNLLHYKISEKLAGGSKVDFAIAEYDVKLSASDKKSFISKVESYEKKTLNKIKQTGGLTTAKKSSHPTKSTNKRRGSSSSSSSSDSDDDFDFASYRRRLMQPISMWYYSPTLYGVNSIFIPTFNAPIIPYVKLWLPM